MERRDDEEYGCDVGGGGAMGVDCWGVVLCDGGP